MVFKLPLFRFYRRLFLISTPDNMWYFGITNHLRNSETPIQQVFHKACILAIWNKLSEISSNNIGNCFRTPFFCRICRWFQKLKFVFSLFRFAKYFFTHILQLSTTQMIFWVIKKLIAKSKRFKKEKLTCWKLVER